MRNEEVMAVERTRLRVGMTILLSNKKYMVELVNGSRARVAPLARKRVNFKHPVTGKEYDFMARDGGAINISPNSEVPILSWTKRNGSANVVQRCRG